MNNIIIVKLDSTYAAVYSGIWQWNYGQILRIQGGNLPKVVEVHFSLQDKGGDSITRIGTTIDGATDVPIPDSFLENGGRAQDYKIYAFIYLEDGTAGNTEYKIEMSVKSRPKPEVPGTPEEPELFRETVKAVNAAADRAEQSEQKAKASEVEAGKYAASASESAVAAEKTKEDALKEVGEKKQGAIEAIQKQEETSVGKIVNHTDNEIQRIQNQTADSKAGLEQTIKNADVSKKELDESIQTASDTKTALDKSVEMAGTAKTELDTSIREAGTAKNVLDESTETAGTVHETLNATVKQAGALDTSLGEKIKTGTQLKTDLTASGEKAVQDIQTAGSEQLGKMQAVAEEFTADREQITTNKEDIGSLKEEIDEITEPVPTIRIIDRNDNWASLKESNYAGQNGWNASEQYDSWYFTAEAEGSIYLESLGTASYIQICLYPSGQFGDSNYVRKRNIDNNLPTSTNPLKITKGAMVIISATKNTTWSCAFLDNSFKELSSSILLSKKHIAQIKDSIKYGFYVLDYTDGVLTVSGNGVDCSFSDLDFNNEHGVFELQNLSYNNKVIFNTSNDYLGPVRVNGEVIKGAKHGEEITDIVRIFADGKELNNGDHLVAREFSIYVESTISKDEFKRYSNWCFNSGKMILSSVIKTLKDLKIDYIFGTGIISCQDDVLVAWINNDILTSDVIIGLNEQTEIITTGGTLVSKRLYVNSSYGDQRVAFNNYSNRKKLYYYTLYGNNISVPSSSVFSSCTELEFS